MNDRRDTAIAAVSGRTGLGKDELALLGSALIAGSHLHMVVSALLSNDFLGAKLTDADIHSLLDKKTLGRLAEDVESRFGVELREQFDDLVAKRNSIMHGLVILDKETGDTWYVHTDRNGTETSLSQDDLCDFIDACTAYPIKLTFVEADRNPDVGSAVMEIVTPILAKRQP